MARKVSRNEVHPELAPRPGADDLDTLLPNRTLTLAGETVTVREYGFAEGLRLQRVAGPVVAALATSAVSGDDGMGTVMDVLAEHGERVFDLVAQSIDKPNEFLHGLSDADGQLLLLTWWGVNGGFFVRRVQMKLAVQRAQTKPPAGATSSPSSSITGTGKATSADTPSGS